MLLALLATLAMVSAAGEPRAREMRVVMETFAEIEIEGAPDPRAALGAAFARIEAVERALSVWRTDSEVSRLNRDGEGTVSRELFDVIEDAVELGRASGGAFDVTLVPYGYARIQLDGGTGRVELNGTALDLGAVLKGRAVDAALESLDASGATSALVDLGTSSMGLFGEELVSIEMRNPKGGAPPASFRVRRGAISSSSRDQLGAHIRDPRTGRPAEQLLAVTVIARSAFEADALSTAVFVLGAADGLRLLEARGAAGIVLVDNDEDDERLALFTTRGFAADYFLEAAAGVTLEESGSRSTFGFRTTAPFSWSK